MQFVAANGEEISSRRRPLAFIAEIYVLFLTFCLPLKFGTLIGVPEIPATYWNNFIGIFAASWPVLTFPVFSGIGLAFTLLFAFPREWRNLSMVILGILWCLFLVSSLAGIVHATTWDFYEHNVIYVFGTAAYALSLLNLFFP